MSHEARYMEEGDRGLKNPPLQGDCFHQSIHNTNSDIDIYLYRHRIWKIFRPY